uniref:Ribosomal protein L21 n=1 Tax=Bigelowiella natans TaxID=227086 RepID=A0A6T7F187_BIGNA|mmetsp:Transcript_2121/g.3208  ORF Transcript_2121/g.3208 Transcript_2121/m.3208 type:complete len:165 (+) Transcript_2121:51-545(+)
MPHSYGYRARTRDLFCKGFRQNGTIATQRYLKTYKLGDLVDIKADGAIQKGMPHKFYHGKTGVIWNVTKRAVGVEVNKVVGGRIMKKRIHVRIEHVKHSTCRKEFLDRVAKNNTIAKLAKKAGKTVSLKREPALQPKEHRLVGVKSTNNSVETLYPEAYVNLFV